MPRKITYKEFEHRITEKFGNEVDLSYIDKENFNYSGKQTFRCIKHNYIFETYPKILLRSKFVCDICRKENFVDNIQNKQTKTRSFITKQQLLDITHNKLTNITIDENSIKHHVEEKVFKTDRIRCVCCKHGEFYTTIGNLIKSKYGCNKCAIEHSSKANIEQGINRRRNFIEEAVKIHGNQYDYSLVDINNKLSKVKIICPVHGVFEMLPSNHITKGQGCPQCNNIQTNCERRLGAILDKNFPNEEIIRQYHGELGRQSLDYYFPKYRIGVEYQGSQHFESNSWLSDYRHSFEHTKELDIKKFNKCNEIGIKVFYFTFSIQYKDIEYFDKIYFYIEELINAIKLQMNLVSSEQQKYINKHN